MSNNFNNELDRMQKLMTYGLNESAKKGGQSIVEYHQEAADGKTYGIIRECNKFYIKVAPKKDTELLAEDYDYIGGFMNKKQYEYPSYNVASKQFDLKMQSLNEAAGRKNAVPSQQFKPVEEADWQVNETREMRAELERFKQISNNVDYILSENKENKGLQLGDPRNVKFEGGDPFTEKPDTTEAINNMKENETDPTKADSTYTEKGEYKEEIKDTVHTDPKTPDNTFKHKVGKLESEGKSVATEKGNAHKNDKGVRMNEGRRTVVLSEKQALAWNRSLDDDYMDISRTGDDTEIGSLAPYTTSKKDAERDLYAEAITVGDNDMNQHTGNPEEYMEPYSDKIYEITLEDDSNGGAMLTDEEISDINEAVLDVFLKHPASRKVPFTTPSNTEIDDWGRDWNDDSVKGNKPCLGENHPPE